MAGYSGRPLIAKLGYKPGQRALMIGVPEDLVPALAFDGFAARVDLVDASALPEGPFELIHLFEREREGLAVLPLLRALLVPSGAIWVSWPKKAAKVPTTVSEDLIRERAIGAGLVDVKVCAVSPVWSGLRLVIPRAARG